VNRGSLARLNPNFGGINYASSDGNSIGHYGSAILAERPAHGFAMRGIYTFGKALDYFSTSGSLDSGEATTFLDNVIQNGALGAQRGRSDFDIRQQLSIDGTWTVPSNYALRAERYVLGGWQFGGVWIMQSGLPFRSTPLRPSALCLAPPAQSSATRAVTTTLTAPITTCQKFRPLDPTSLASPERPS
jgi:hypothetical protein